MKGELISKDKLVKDIESCNFLLYFQKKAMLSMLDSSEDVADLAYDRDTDNVRYSAYTTIDAVLRHLLGKTIRDLNALEVMEVNLIVQDICG